MADELPDLPGRKDWAYRMFRWYAVRYVRKHFHGVRLSRAGFSPPETDLPLVVVMNHPSWWDPMAGLVLTHRLGEKTHYAPIESAALRQYKFFARLGFFGVDPGTTRGAREFLRTAEQLMKRPGAMLWVTAQGSFRDVRERPIALRPGVGFLAQRLGRGYVLPLALEYVFWEERTPEILMRWGEPLDMATNGTGREWTERIEAALTTTQDELATEAIRRDPALFENLLEGRVGIGGVYDIWRRFKAWLRGERFQASHGNE